MSSLPEVKAGAVVNTPLPVGSKAPEFTLESGFEKKISLADFRGQPVILAFYPADWSPVCGSQLVLYNQVLPEFRKANAQLLGISVDGIWCHSAFEKSCELRYPLLSDFEPKGAVSREYGTYNEKEGVCERSLFVIDPAGLIRWSQTYPMGTNPGADVILRALEVMNFLPEQVGK